MSRSLGLRHHGAMTFDEIGIELGITPQHAWRLCRNGLAKLRKRYGRDAIPILQYLGATRTSRRRRPARGCE